MIYTSCNRVFIIHVYKHLIKMTITYLFLFGHPKQTLKGEEISC